MSGRGHTVKLGVLRFTPAQLGWKYIDDGIWCLPNGELYQIRRAVRDAPPDTDMTIVVIVFPKEISDGEISSRVQIRFGLDLEEGRGEPGGG